MLSNVCMPGTNAAAPQLRKVGSKAAWPRALHRGRLCGRGCEWAQVAAHVLGYPLHWAEGVVGHLEGLEIVRYADSRGLPKHQEVNNQRGEGRLQDMKNLILEGFRWIKMHAKRGFQAPTSKGKKGNLLLPRARASESYSKAFLKKPSCQILRVIQ